MENNKKTPDIEVKKEVEEVGNEAVEETVEASEIVEIQEKAKVEETVVEETVVEEAVEEEIVEAEVVSEVIENESLNEVALEEVEVEPMESIVETKTLYNFKTLKYANMYILRVKRKSRVKNLIFIGILLATATYFLIMDIKDNGNFVFPIVLGALIILFGTNIVTEESKVDRSLHNFFRQHQPFTQTFAINNDRIRVSAEIEGEVKSIDYPWPYVTEIHIINEYYFLFVNNASPMVIERKDSSFIKGTQDQLIEILKQKAEYKPFKIYNKDFFRNKNFPAEDIIDQE